MRIRFLLALLALGVVSVPTYAEHKKTKTAPDTQEVAPIVAPPIDVSPIIRAAAVEFIPPPLPTPRLATVPVSKAMVSAPPVFVPETRRLSVKAYAVADLVIPIPGLNANGTMGEALNAPPATTERELIKNIVASIAPKSWHANGGDCTIEYFPNGYTLVVNASHDVQEQVQGYLEGLRKKLDTQVCLEIRVITLSDALFGDMGMAKVFAVADAAAGKTPVKFVSDEQVKKFLERIQADPLTSVMMAPKITALDGQECAVQSLDQQMFVTKVTAQTVGEQLLFVPTQETIDLGLLARLRPQLSADTTKLSLEAQISFKQLAETPVRTSGLTTMITPVFDDGKKGEPVPFTQMIQHPKVLTREAKETMTIPVGRSVMMYAGKATVKTMVRHKLPLLADVPIVSELLSKEVPETKTDHMIVVITPHVIKPECDSEECELAPKSTDRLSKLLAEYHHACKTGKTDEARRLAIECLTIDPMCFRK